MHTLHFSGHSQLAPLAVICGTGVLPPMGELAYKPWTIEGVTGTFALTWGGLGHLDATYLALVPQLVNFYHKHGQFVVVGHSQGGYHAMRFGVEHPEMVTGVVCMCGAHAGVEKDSWAGSLLHWMVPHASVEPELRAGSLQTNQLLEVVGMQWSPYVGLSLVVAGGDALILPHRRGHHAMLPEGQHARRIYVGPRRPAHLPPEFEYRWAPVAGHTTVIYTPAIIGLLRSIRQHHHPALAAA